MKKEELEYKLEEAELKLKDLEHMAEAVEAKDKEIQKLKTNRAEDVASIKNEMARRINVLELENQSLRERLSSQPDGDKLKEVIDKLTNDNKKLTSFVNQHIRAFRNYLKMQQASLENTIELEALVSEQLNNK